MTKVLYPGSFDPITNGHMNIIFEASKLFDEVIVAVMQNPKKKNSMFSTEERVEMIKELYSNSSNISVISFEGATVDAALLNNCKAIVRGLRSLTDFDYEIQLEQVNKEISNGEVLTICLFADKEYQYVSSSMVKEVFNLDKDVSKYVPSLVLKKMKAKR